MSEQKQKRGRIGDGWFENARALHASSPQEMVEKIVLSVAADERMSFAMLLADLADRMGDPEMVRKGCDLSGLSDENARLIAIGARFIAAEVIAALKLKPMPTITFQFVDLTPQGRGN